MIDGELERSIERVFSQAWNEGWDDALERFEEAFDGSMKKANAGLTPSQHDDVMAIAKAVLTEMRKK